MYETWGAEADDWDTQEYTDDQLINALYDVSSAWHPHPMPPNKELQSVGLHAAGTHDSRTIFAHAQDNSSPESVAQNVLAVTLALLLFLAVGNIVWKIVAVSWALVSAAVRYSTVAFILVCIAVFLA